MLGLRVEDALGFGEALLLLLLLEEGERSGDDDPLPGAL